MRTERELKLAAIWRTTHPDYRGMVDGHKAILLYCGGAGTCLVRLDELNEKEIEEKYRS
jgi:hypothetical protein